LEREFQELVLLIEEFIVQVAVQRASNLDEGSHENLALCMFDV